MEEGGRGGEIMRMEERGSGRESVETNEWKSGGVDECKNSRVEESRTSNRKIEDCWSGRVGVEEEMSKQQSREYGQHQRE
jgi:hypothetical protein